MIKHYLPDFKCKKIDLCSERYNQGRAIVSYAIRNEQNEWEHIEIYLTGRDNELRALACTPYSEWDWTPVMSDEFKEVYKRILMDDSEWNFADKQIDEWHGKCLTLSWFYIPPFTTTRTKYRKEINSIK